MRFEKMSRCDFRMERFTRWNKERLQRFCGTLLACIGHKALFRERTYL